MFESQGLTSYRQVQTQTDRQTDRQTEWLCKPAEDDQTLKQIFNDEQISYVQT